MTHVLVVLVEPRVEGNVGAIARSMANFGLADLVLLNPCPLGSKAYRRSKHGRIILKEARSVDTLDEALLGADIGVGTTGISTMSERAFHRHTLTPRELAKKLSQVSGTAALVLGREDYGLLNEELSQLDLLVHVPCHPDYPVMNISHAAAVLFYELYEASGLPHAPRRRLASGFEKEKLLEAFREFLVTTRYPMHRSRRTEVMFRRLLGRAFPTKWEFHALMGALRGASKTVKRLSESRGTGPSS
ncbi:MAG: RNA methyltransferase [Thermoplasmata archaeon]